MGSDENCALARRLRDILNQANDEFRKLKGSPLIKYNTVSEIYRFQIFIKLQCVIKMSAYSGNNKGRAWEISRYGGFPDREHGDSDHNHTPGWVIDYGEISVAQLRQFTSK